MTNKKSSPIKSCDSTHMKPSGIDESIETEHAGSCQGLWPVGQEKGREMMAQW